MIGTMEKLTFVYDIRYGDWVVVYLGDKKVFEGHSVSGPDLAYTLDLDHDTIDWSPVNEDDGFPESLKEISGKNA